MQFLLPDVAFELAVSDGLKEGQQFLPVPAGLQFHPAVRKVAHPARYLEPAGLPANAVPEADALDTSLEE